MPLGVATAPCPWVFKPSQAGTYTVQASYTTPDTTNYAGTATSPSASFIGTTSDGRGALGVTLADHSDGAPGRSLYLAEGGDITEIANPATCAGSCVASRGIGRGDDRRGGHERRENQ